MTTENKIALAAIVTGAIVQIIAALLPSLIQSRKTNPDKRPEQNRIKSLNWRVKTTRIGFVFSCFIAAIIFYLEFSSPQPLNRLSVLLISSTVAMFYCSLYSTLAARVTANLYETIDGILDLFGKEHESRYKVDNQLLDLIIEMQKQPTTRFSKILASIKQLLN